MAHVRPANWGRRRRNADADRLRQRRQFFRQRRGLCRGPFRDGNGNILKKMGWSHQSFLVSSKVFWGGELPNSRGLCRKHVMEACENALGRLQVDYLDFYFCHRPDTETPIEETVRAMSDLVHQGKVLYWGTSEWSAQEITQAHAHCAGVSSRAADDGAADVHTFSGVTGSSRNIHGFMTSMASARRSGRRWPPVFSPANTTGACRKAAVSG